MPATINTYVPNQNGGGYNWDPTYASQNPQGQTFYTPNSSDVVLDRITTRVVQNTNVTSVISYTADVYRWINGQPSGPSLSTASGTVEISSTNEKLFDIDFPDIQLNPLDQYAFTLTKTSGPSTVVLSPYTNSSYSRGAFVLLQGVNNWLTFSSDDLGFIAYFNTPPAPAPAAAAGAPLSVPSGNFNEQTNIAINLSGTFGGTGTFDIANPEQSGNNDVKTGKYGSLTVSNTGEFSYSVNLDKVDSLNTGENPVDEFTINLTSPTGAVSSATYRVQIEGYTDPTPGPGPTPAEKSITITGNRGTVSGKPGIIVDGDTTGFDPGTKLVPYVRFPGQTQYTQGSARPEVGADGGFTWQRKTGKKTYVYFKNEAESIQSNRVIVPAAFKDVAGGALSDAGLDPIISGGTSPFHKGHSEGKAKRNRRSPAFSLVDSEANAPAFGAQLMAADPFSTNTVGADTGLFPVASGDFI